MRDAKVFLNKCTSVLFSPVSLFSDSGPEFINTTNQLSSKLFDNHRAPRFPNSSDYKSLISEHNTNPGNQSGNVCNKLVITWLLKPNFSFTPRIPKS